jgi:hypothetical protein
LLGPLDRSGALPLGVVVAAAKRAPDNQGLASPWPRHE